MAAIVSVLAKIATMQRESAPSMHANSVGVATTDLHSLWVTYPLATCLDGSQLGCTST